MRSDARAYDLLAPATLAEALDAMADGTRLPFAGGTEVMVALCAGRLVPRQFLSLHRLGELRFLDKTDPQTLRIGAATTFTDLRQSEVVLAEFPLLAQTAGWTGSVANQNRGTLGGNIANASPAADNPPALLAYDAALEIVSAAGSRTVPYAAFHLGYKRTALQPGELIFAVRLPRRFSAHIHFVRKVGTRNAQAISKVALAGVARVEAGRLAQVALAAASLHDRPLRLHAVEAALLGTPVGDAGAAARAVAALSAEIAPIDDIRSTAQYRAAVGKNLLLEFLEAIATGVGGAEGA